MYGINTYEHYVLYGLHIVLCRVQNNENGTEQRCNYDIKTNINIFVKLIFIHLLHVLVLTTCHVYTVHNCSENQRNQYDSINK